MFISKHEQRPNRPCNLIHIAGGVVYQRCFARGKWLNGCAHIREHHQQNNSHNKNNNNNLYTAVYFYIYRGLVHLWQSGNYTPQSTHIHDHYRPHASMEHTAYATNTNNDDHHFWSRQYFSGFCV